MFGLEPYFSLPLVGLLIILCGALAFWTVYRFRGLVPGRFLATLGGLRLLALLALLALLINPFFESTRPDPNAFRVVVLADFSGSMETRDLSDGRLSRADLLQRWLDPSPDGILQPLREADFMIEKRAFAEEAIPLPPGPPSPLPGLTAIGDVLSHELDRREDDLPEIGAVVILTDGHSNRGRAPIEAARRYRDRGIPITAIGIGNDEEKREVSLRFTENRLSVTRGESVTLRAEAHNPTRETREIQVQITDDDGVLQSETLTLPPESSTTLSQSVTPWQSPFQMYRLSGTITGDPDSPNLLDYAAVEIRDRDTFRLLYLGGAMTPEFRFLRRTVESSDELSLEAIIRTGPNRFFENLDASRRAAFSEAHENGDNALPVPTEPGFLFAFDGIIVDSRILFELPSATVDQLSRFADQRGGGLLFLGPVEAIPTPLERILPILETQAQLTFRRSSLYIEPAPVFSRIDGGSLFRSPRPFLPEESTVHWVTRWKRGARPIIADNEGERALLVAQAYGAGRVAYLGMETSWRWRLESDQGLQHHQQFWQNLLVWLSSQGKPRLRIPDHGASLPLYEERELAIEVLGSDFRPAREGDLSVRVEDPSGETEIFPLTPSFAQPGRFTVPFTPQQAGEYRLRFRIDLPDGEQLEREAFFLASAMGRELENVAYREDVLRDLARLTEGRFISGESLRPLRDLPLREDLPVREERHYLAFNWFFLLLLALPLLYEWYLRRTHGLR